MKWYRYVFLVIAIILPILIVYGYYAYYRETDSTWINQCTIYKFTGLDCPGCGGQRSLHFLLHGNIVQALHYNILFIIGLPFLAYFYYIAIRVYILNQREYLKSFVFSKKFAYIFLAVLLVFFILRNIPIPPFTYLSPP